MTADRERAVTRSRGAGRRPAGQATARLSAVGFAFMLALSVAADFLLDKHGLFGIDGTFGFAAWYGLASCVALVLAAAALGLILRRPDNDDDE